MIGVGNPYRRDDGVGIEVIERLRDRRLPDVEIFEESGEPAALIARWAEHSFVIMIDAVTSGGKPGDLQRIECHGGGWQSNAVVNSASTHGLGLADAVELGLALNRIPDRLLIFGVETGDVSSGTGLSPDVAKAVDDVVQAVVNEVSAVVGDPS